MHDDIAMIICITFVNCMMLSMLALALSHTVFNQLYLEIDCSELEWLCMHMSLQLLVAQDQRSRSQGQLWHPCTCSIQCMP